ncbi:MAG TPA: LamG domain-containing protein, partial [Phycisphaerales bacterium]|nr:LamG domain-containing protein [Phycisphaerales bacterium]
MGPAHEELSVNNASPYRNRAVIDYGMSGSASVDPSIQNTIRVQDQLDKPRGLNQRATLHCGPFGIDPAYGEVLTDTYSTVPSWHKTNRNRHRRPALAEIVYAPVAAIGWASVDQIASPRLYLGDDADWETALGGLGNDALPLSISVWFYINSFDTDGTFIWNLGNGNRRLYVGGTTLQACIGGVTLAAGTISTGQWYHVVATYDGGTNIGTGAGKVYVNAALINSNTGDDTAVNIIGSQGLALGWNVAAADRWDLIGQLAEINIYQRAITQEEVTSLYNGGKVPTSLSVISGSGNLLARYAFSEAAGRPDTAANIYNQVVAEGTTYDSLFVENYTLGTASGSLTYPGNASYFTESFYDNLYVQHAIPRSEQQYSWITASLATGQSILGLDAPSCFSASALSQLITESDLVVARKSNQPKAKFAADRGSVQSP